MTLANLRTTARSALDLLPSLFFAITFLQAGIDKIVDRAGGLSYFRSHFGKTFAARIAEPLFWAVMVLELGSGILAALGALQILLGGGKVLALWGLIVSSVTVLCLFLGQRVARDYAGASGLVPYFITALLGLFLIGYAIG